MAGVTLAGSAFTTTAGNKTVTATPALGDIIVIIAASTGVATTAISDNNAEASAWTQLGSNFTGFSTTGTLNAWIRGDPIRSATSTIFTATQTSSTGGGLVVLRLSDILFGGSAALRSSGGQSSGTAATTPAPVLGATPVTESVIILAVANGTNSATTVVPRTSFTEAFDNGYNTPATGLEVCWRASGETTATQTFGGTTASTFASIALEISTAKLPPPPNIGKFAVTRAGSY